MPPDPGDRMSQHNLPSRSLAEMMDELAARLDGSQRHGWLDTLLGSWGEMPNNAPLSTEAAVLGHVLTGLRGLKFHFARRSVMQEAELLDAVIRHNGEHPRSVYIEYVEGGSIDAALARYIVHKGVLFETRLAQTILCWHPDKDFTPKGAERVHRTGHSALGRRKRRREAARRAAGG